jgi:hypothetical protein
MTISFHPKKFKISHKNKRNLKKSLENKIPTNKVSIRV